MPRVYKRRPLAMRFWEKVSVRDPDECWPWNASKDRDGYGKFSVNRGTWRRAHRVAFEMIRTDEPLLPSDVLCHRCDNPSCCNPFHMFRGTRADNTRDAAQKGRTHRPSVAQTHCKHGHEFTPENTYVYTNSRSGYRQRACVACSKERYARNKKALAMKGAAA